ncbi:2,5-diamino-6-(ribosylamino)-4(3H)-pyrimidinone 5'-phosphate reductase [Tulasnella sp. 330]|nr:2,5-diamino-6-(ribosylamino)-4(3H)-pyrimidinone 5'-phosphate reductase [Tulasnella sp. 330]KAG8873938.1 2,5-diamino-6-(ribosylamino)-4(3H)-pyrimidinone 5'-phosphate reductase [Tulasnella sp. 331]KAG8878998.1 2,5-diamino-6-(ribosylamino)-4(3H)-pyrimidinone 5'-phosphate reductase [Tulasnella sp. 332]
MAESLKAAQSYLECVLGDINSSDYSQLHPGRPHVTLTYAQSLDGKIAGKGGAQLPLSGDESWVMTHWMRSMHEGIVVGIGTVLNDNPGLAPTKLPPRDEPYPAPTPIILDTNLRIPTSSKVIARYQSGEGKRPIILCKPDADPRKRAALEAIGSVVIQVETHPTRGHLTIHDALAKLSQRGIRSVMVEGGAQVISRFLESPQADVDSVIITVSPMWVGSDGLNAISMAEGHVLPKLEHVKSVVMGKDTVVACRPVVTSS